MKLKQGQTVYLIDVGTQHWPFQPFITKWFLYSHKQTLPPRGFNIDKLPVTYANDLLSKGFKLYTSRRKALKQLKETKKHFKEENERVDQGILI